MPLLGHDFAEDLAGKHGAENVEIEDPAERVCGQIKEAEVGAGGGGGLVATGAVDEAVDFAELGDHSLSCLGDAVLVERVAREERDLLAMLAEVGDERPGRFDIQIEDGDLRAATCKRTRDFTAEDPCAASDDDDHSGEVVHADELRQIEGNVLCAVGCMFHWVRCGGCHRRSSCVVLFRTGSVTQVRSGLTRVQ